MAIRHFLGLTLTDRIPPVSCELGTTRGTNALLTRRGARTAFVTTRGFGDVLADRLSESSQAVRAGDPQAEPLFAAVVEIDERVDADGQVLRAPDRSKSAAACRVREQGIESLAICLLHASANRPTRHWSNRSLAKLGFREISVSSRVAPLIKIVSRGDTTVVDAYLESGAARLRRAARRALGRANCGS